MNDVEFTIWAIVDNFDAEFDVYATKEKALASLKTHFRQNPVLYEIQGGSRGAYINDAWDWKDLEPFLPKEDEEDE